MNIQNNNLISENCFKHNKPVLLYDPQFEQGPYCIDCLENQTKLITSEKLYQLYQKLEEKAHKAIQNEKQLLQNSLDLILSYKATIIFQLDKIITIINDQKQTLNQTIFQIQQKASTFSFQQNKLKLLQLESQKQLEINKQFRDLVIQQFQMIKNNYLNIDHLIAQFEHYQQDNEDYFAQNQQSFHYDLMEESQIFQQEKCFSFCFDKDSDTLVVARDSCLIVYQFNNGKISKELQQIADHTNRVYCLYFLKKTKSFISGSWDTTIIFWILDENNKWVRSRQLKSHNKFILCILVNKNEDKLISSCHETIRYWIKNNNNDWILKQTINTMGPAYSLSLNEQENILIACGSHQQIEILRQQNEIWIPVQIIEIKNQGERLCFIYGDQFVFQPSKVDYLEIYDLDKNSNQFQKISTIKTQISIDCTWSFQCQFIQKKKILTVKHGQYLNIFSIIDSNKYVLMQTIDFGHHYLYGRLTDNGEFLITWDFSSKKIQVRQLKSME